jgi:hypothetical protein
MLKSSFPERREAGYLKSADFPIGGCARNWFKKQEITPGYLTKGASGPCIRLLYIIPFDLNIRIKDEQIAPQCGVYLVLNRRFGNEIEQKSIFVNGYGCGYPICFRYGRACHGR